MTVDEFGASESARDRVRARLDELCLPLEDPCQDPQDPPQRPVHKLVEFNLFTYLAAVPLRQTGERPLRVGVSATRIM